MTEAERVKYRTWWLERSGLSLVELREIAVGLGVLRTGDDLETTPRPHEQRT
jgi:hypothetical protein